MEHTHFWETHKKLMWPGQLFQISSAILNALRILRVLSALSGVSELNSQGRNENMLDIPPQ